MGAFKNHMLQWQEARLALTYLQRDTVRCEQENIDESRLASETGNSYDRKTGYFICDNLYGDRKFIWHLAWQEVRWLNNF